MRRYWIAKLTFGRSKRILFLKNFLVLIMMVLRSTHRHTRKHSNAPTTVRVGHYITISHTEEGYGNEPHCVEQICMFLIVISVGH